MLCNVLVSTVQQSERAICVHSVIVVLVAQSCLTLRPRGLQPAGLLCPWNSPGKNTGVGCHSLLQGIFPTEGSNLGVPHCRQILYCLHISLIFGFPSHLDNIPFLLSVPSPCMNYSVHVRFTLQKYGLLT